jgi:hypothetical protein
MKRESFDFQKAMSTIHNEFDVHWEAVKPGRHLSKFQKSLLSLSSGHDTK